MTNFMWPVFLVRINLVLSGTRPQTPGVQASPIYTTASIPQREMSARTRFQFPTSEPLGFKSLVAVY